MPETKDFDEVLAAAVDDLTANGYDSAERVERWARLLRAAAERSMIRPEALEQRLRDGLAAIYRKMVERGGILRYNPGVERFTFERIKPALRPELDRRIMASTSLIRLNRAEAIEQTVRRFQGWATSVPPGGVSAETRGEVRTNVRKSLRSLPFEERRVLIDQGNKLVASINDVVARDGGAIAARWRSHWRQPGYNYRPDHKERDEKVYLIRDSWAYAAKLVKPGRVGYLDEVTQPGQEPFCRCVPGSTKIPFANVCTIYRREYSGTLIEITTSSGKSLRLTPNHPVLTAQGWLGADSLQMGDDLVEGIEQIIESLTKENKNDAIPTIAEIFEFLDPRGRKSSAQGSCHQFHGDGLPDRDINIVFADRPLRIGIREGYAQSIQQFRLTHSALSCSIMRSLSKSFLRFWSTTLCFASGFATPLFNLIAFFGQPELLGFGSGSQSNPSLYYAVTNGPVRCSVLLSQFIRTHSFRIFPRDFFSWKVRSFLSKIYSGFGLIANADTSPSQPSTDCRVGNLKLLCQLYGINASKVCFGKIVDIKRNLFSGHVYNLETIEGWYVANGILSHNCYCIYKYNLRDLPEDMLTARGKASLASVQGTEEVRAARKGRADAIEPITQAYYEGQAAFRAGLPENANPYPNGKLAKEWLRAYKNERKRARFNTTIAKRQDEQDDARADSSLLPSRRRSTIPVPVDREHDVPWMFVVSRRCDRLYQDRSIPRHITIAGRTVDPAELGWAHERGEWLLMMRMILAFRERFGREPDDAERAAIYDHSHEHGGIPAERRRAAELRVDWDAWQAWSRGELARLERERVRRPVPDPHVRPAPGDPKQPAAVVAPPPPDALSEALDQAHRLDRLRYLDGVREVRWTADVDEWHAEFVPESDEITVRAKFAGLPFDERALILLHEAGHRGEEVDAATFEEFKALGLVALSSFVEMANPVHLRDFERRGKVDHLASEVFAESYARCMLGKALPPELAEFWHRRLGLESGAEAA